MQVAKNGITAAAFLSMALAAGVAAAQSFDMKEQAGVRWTCGGIGVNEREALAKLEPQSDLKLVFAGGKQGAYLANVAVTLTDADGKRSALQFTANAPICLIQAPAGSYRVEAAYGDARRSAAAEVGKSKQPQTVILHFPRVR